MCVFLPPYLPCDEPPRPAVSARTCLESLELRGLEEALYLIGHTVPGRRERGADCIPPCHLGTCSPMAAVVVQAAVPRLMSGRRVYAAVISSSSVRGVRAGLAATPLGRSAAEMGPNANSFNRADPPRQRRSSVAIPRAARDAPLLPDASHVHQGALGADINLSGFCALPCDRGSDVRERAGREGRG